MRTWRFYDLQTGKFRTKTYSSKTDKDIEKNIPTGCAPFEGEVGKYQKIDLETLKLVDDEEAVTARAIEKADRVARSTIKELELSQFRAMRELALGDKNAEARLQEIDDKIAAQRGNLISQKASK